MRLQADEYINKYHIHMSYNINYYPVTRIKELEARWRELEKGEEMTWFQRYSWYEKLAAINGAQYKNHEIVFAEVRHGQTDETLLIAPLWIVKRTFRLLNRKGAYFFGHQGWNDYNNLVYKEFTPPISEAFIALMNDLKRLYGITYWQLERIRETTSFCRWIEANSAMFQMERQTRSICVALDLPETYDEWWKMLSKSARQNIRTAGNRMKKDGVEVTFNPDDKYVDMAQFTLWRNKRVADKNAVRIRSMADFKEGAKMAILKRTRFYFPEYTPFEGEFRAETRIATLCHNDTLIAAFCYGYDEVRRRILVVAVSINEDYHRYSPGIELFRRFIEHCIDGKKIRTIDFTRGNEKYKYTLGGSEHYNRQYRFRYVGKA